MAEDKPAASFRKTKSGSWAVMAPLEDLEKALAGDGKIEVLKKSGDWSSYTVVSLGSPFDANGIKMCYGYDREQEDDQSKQTPSPQGAQDTRKPASLKVTPTAPAADPSEPLPEFQGGAEDEWSGQ